MIASQLIAIVKKLDPSRPVTAALAAPELSNLTGLAGLLDVSGYNYKEHLYASDHEAYPQRIILGSENGKYREQWLAVSENDYISGLFLWTGYDFLGETRGWPSHGSEAGLINTAGFKKPAYYMWQSFWQIKPVVKLFTAPADLLEQPVRESVYSRHLSENWNYTAGETAAVYCFTNCLKAELFLNDESIGGCDIVNEGGYMRWQIPFRPGCLRVKAISCKWTGDKRSAGYSGLSSVCSGSLL